MTIETPVWKPPDRKCFPRGNQTNDGISKRMFGNLPSAKALPEEAKQMTAIFNPFPNRFGILLNLALQV